MVNFLLQLNLALLVVMGSNGVSAFSLNHFEIMSGVYTTNASKSQAREAFKEVNHLSRALAFLNCPFKLIELQYNGIESVNLGLKYLIAYFDDSTINKIRFQNINYECQSDLHYYRKKVRSHEKKSRAVSEEEIFSLASTFTKNTSETAMRLTHLVMASLNQETACYVRRSSISVAYIFGGSLGESSVECFTPLGRHFLLNGPSFGYGLGIITALTLPNSRLLPSAPNWSFKLYEPNHSPLFHEGHKSVQSTLIAGVTTEVKNKKSSLMRYRRDIKPTIGGGLMVEHVHNFFYQTSLPPLYFALSKAIDLRATATRMDSLISR